MMESVAKTFLLREEGKDITSGTIKEHKIALTQYCEWCEQQGLEIAGVNALEIEDYLAFLKREGYAGTTVSQKFNTIRKLYAYLEKRGAIEENPVEDVDLKAFVNGKTAKSNTDNDFYLKQEEFDQMLEHVPDPKLRNQLILKLLWQTGLRRGELAEIKLEDVDRDERSIRVKTKKTGEVRRVWYKPSLDFLMDQWISVYRDGYPHSDSPYLFVTKQSGQIYTELINRTVKMAADGAGLQEEMYQDARQNSRKKITAHTLRHSYAVHCIKSGMDVSLLRELMGHNNLETTKQYLRFRDEDIKSAAQKYGPE